MFSDLYSEDFSVLNSHPGIRGVLSSPWLEAFAFKCETFADLLWGRIKQYHSPGRGDCRKTSWHGLFMRYRIISFCRQRYQAQGAGSIKEPRAVRQGAEGGDRVLEVGDYWGGWRRYWGVGQKVIWGGRGMGESDSKSGKFLMRGKMPCWALSIRKWNLSQGV